MKNYTYPPEVHIGGHVFKVEMIDGCATNMYINSVGHTSVECADLGIAVRTNDGGYKHPDELDATFCHEITHQVSNVWGVGIDEKQTDQIAEGWMQALHSMGIRIIREV